MERVPFPRLISAPVTPEWNASDAAAFKHFLSTSTGKKLIGRARAFECAMALKSVQDPTATLHSSGRACGISDGINWIFSLSVASPEDEANASLRYDESAEDDSDVVKINRK